jgi:hypothetical protein
MAYGLWLGVRARTAETKNRLLFPTNGAFPEPSAISHTLFSPAIRHLPSALGRASRFTFNVSREIVIERRLLEEPGEEFGEQTSFQ